MAEAMREDPELLAFANLLENSIANIHVGSHSVSSYMNAKIAAALRRAAAPPEGVRAEPWRITKMEHAHRPQQSLYERDYLIRKLNDGGPKAVASILFSYALSQPTEGSFAGSLWAIAEWVSTYASALSPAAAGGEEKWTDQVFDPHAFRKNVYSGSDRCSLCGKPENLHVVPAALSSSGVGGETFTSYDAWDDLVEKTDRTSPEEYPDMCLITFNELQDYITRGFSAQSARVKSLEAKALEMRNAIDMIEGSLMGAGELIDIPGKFEESRDELLVMPKITLGQLRRITRELAECTRIVNSDEYEARALLSSSDQIQSTTETKS